METRKLYHLEVYRWEKDKCGKRKKVYYFNSRNYGNSAKEVRDRAKSYYKHKSYVIKVRRIK